MGKHDSDEEIGSFLGGAQGVKNAALGIKNNIKIIFLILLIPVVGFGVYMGVKYFSNKNNTTPVSGVIPPKVEDKKEYAGGYEVIGSVKIEKVGIDLKILDPVKNDINYSEDALNFGAVLYYGSKLNENGNCSILAHNNANNFVNLKNVEVDDQIIVADSNGVEVEYSVTSKETVEADNLSVLLNSDENLKEITLITCEEAGTTRLVVKAISK